MTRKDYVAIAEALKSGVYDGMTEIRAAIHRDYVNRIAATLAVDNPRFDRERFLKAAGVQ